jgi:hypothetical protein
MGKSSFQVLLNVELMISPGKISKLLFSQICPTSRYYSFGSKCNFIAMDKKKEKGTSIFTIFISLIYRYFYYLYLHQTIQRKNI